MTASYQYQTRDELTGDERDLRFATGLNLGVPPGIPPNVRAIEIYDRAVRDFWLPPLFNLDASGNPVSLDDPSGVTPVFATQLPESNDGVVTIADFAGRTPTAASRPEAGRGLIPSRDDHAIRVSAQQELVGDLLLSGSITYTAGDTSSLEQNHTLSVWVGEATNPWSPNPWSPFPYPVRLELELPFLPDTERFTNKKGLNVDIALDGRLSENWEWTLFGQRSKLDNDGKRFNVLDFRARSCLGVPNSFRCSGRSAGLNVFLHPLYGLDSEQEFIDLFVIPTGNTVNESREAQYELVSQRNAL